MDLNGERLESCWQSWQESDMPIAILNGREGRTIARAVEFGSGIVAAVVAVIVAAVAVALGGAGAGIVIALGGIGAGVAAYQHSQGHEGPWRGLLWGSALLLLVMTVLGVFSIGLFLLPGTLAALTAAGVATWRSSTEAPAQ
jgi:hypothetical protein